MVGTDRGKVPLCRACRRYGGAEYPKGGELEHHLRPEPANQTIDSL